MIDDLLTKVALQQTEECNSLRAIAILQPEGGGAVDGMGEKFATNPVTGWGSTSLPSFTRVSALQSGSFAFTLNRPGRQNTNPYLRVC